MNKTAIPIFSQGHFLAVGIIAVAPDPKLKMSMRKNGWGIWMRLETFLWQIRLSCLRLNGFIFE